MFLFFGLELFDCFVGFFFSVNEHSMADLALYKGLYILIQTCWSKLFPLHCFKLSLHW